MLLTKIRLSWFFFGFLVIFLVGTYVIKGVTFTAGALTLFSVNSFLYGFYISPVLNSQKQRIDELQKTIRSEANALFDMLLKTKRLPGRTRNNLQHLFVDYMEASFRQRKPAEGEDEYERLISFCLEYEGAHREEIDKILGSLSANQQNRSQLAMQLRNKVYSNEWWVMLVLFSITIGFVFTLNTGTQWTWILHIVKALLCTALSMLMINLLKLSTLTHKRAKRLWDPLNRLMDSRFYRID